jgi:hypothetical protein
MLEYRLSWVIDSWQMHPFQFSLESGSRVRFSSEVQGAKQDEQRASTKAGTQIDFSDSRNPLRWAEHLNRTRMANRGQAVTWVECMGSNCNKFWFSFPCQFRNGIRWTEVIVANYFHLGGNTNGLNRCHIACKYSFVNLHGIWRKIKYQFPTRWNVVEGDDIRRWSVSLFLSGKWSWQVRLDGFAWWPWHLLSVFHDPPI